MDFTEEQKKVIEFVKKGPSEALVEIPTGIGTGKAASQNLAVNAYAGTGKTSTLVGLVEAVPHKRFLYVVFNRAIKLEAEKKFPKNCKVSTLHSLAYTHFAREYYREALQPRLSLRWRNFDYIKHYEVVKQHYNSASFLCFAAKTTMNRFKNSAAEEITKYHFSKEHQKEITPREEDYVVDLARKMWVEELDKTTKTPITHDTYLKAYQLSKPQISNYEIVLLDEAQDTNPVAESIIASFGKQTVLVGDSFQAIYKWRGAVNTLKRYKEAGTPTLWLTQSFRFGTEIAKMATTILKVIDLQTPTVLGNPELHSSIGELNKNKQYTMLFRTNASLASEALDLLEEKKDIYIEGGVKQLCDDLGDLYLLSIGDRTSGKSDKYRPFKLIEEVQEEALHSKDIKKDLKFIDTYGKDVPELLELLRTSVRTRRAKSVDVILSTAHKAKGLEWEQVLIARDFEFLPSEDEWNLVYVAITRAQKVLEVNSALLYKNLENFRKIRYAIPDKY